MYRAEASTSGGDLRTHPSARRRGGHWRAGRSGRDEAGWRMPSRLSQSTAVMDEMERWYAVVTYYLPNKRGPRRKVSTEIRDGLAHCTTHLVGHGGPPYRCPTLPLWFCASSAKYVWGAPSRKGPRKRRVSDQEPRETGPESNQEPSCVWVICIHLAALSQLVCSHVP